MIPKGMYRNPKLLKFAKDIDTCHGCGKYRPNEIVAAHSNSLSHGKGTRIKAHDCFIAYLCHECHTYVDSDSKATRQEKFDFWRSSHDITILWLFMNKIKI